MNLPRGAFPFSFFRRTLLIGALLSQVAWSRGEEPGRQTLTIELPRGVKVDVSTPTPVRDEDLADLLETYVRQLRAKQEAKDSLPLTPAALAANTGGPPTEPKEVVHAPQDAAEVKDVGENPFGWFPTRRLVVLPTTLLWQPPLANPYEPRFYIKQTSLSTAEFSTANDFNIGGTLALFRIAPVDCPENGFQLDLFGMALSRFANRNYQAATDYRFGVPLTFARGPWSAKLSYEHTSTHLGDEFIFITHARESKDGIREEVTAGLAYRPLEELRLYGIFGYAMHVSTFTEDPKPERFSFGAEWSRPVSTGWRGQPFAAADLEFRGDAEYTPNLTAQVGWQWLAHEARPGFRVALEYYDGRSQFGQFLDRHESWVGLGFYFDY